MEMRLGRPGKGEKVPKPMSTFLVQLSMDHCSTGAAQAFTNHKTGADNLQVRTQLGETASSQPNLLKSCALLHFSSLALNLIQNWQVSSAIIMVSVTT